MIWTSILLALRAIRRNVMRSMLTVLGIVIGVAAVITMVTLGRGATASISSQIEALGSNLVIVQPGKRLGPGRDSAGSPNFKAADADAIRSEVPLAALVAPTTTKSVTLVYAARNWSTSVTGTTVDYFAIGNWKLAGGRIFTEPEQRAGAAVCVIGETVRKELFGQQNPVGSAVRVKSFGCEVIGLLVAKGQSAMGMDQDDVVVMPLRTAQRRLNGNQDVGRIMVSAADSASTDRAKQDVQLLMRERRRLSDNEEDNFSVFDTRQIAQTMTGTTQVLTALLGAVAAVSLLVGGIGIMNIMLVSVTERTREIGTRLAIGALEHEVLIQFLVEAVVLAALGGLAGIVLAAAASFVLAQLMQVPFLFQPGINLLAFLVAAATGVVFGYLPARRAARLDPIEALRHE